MKPPVSDNTPVSLPISRPSRVKTQSIQGSEAVAGRLAQPSVKSSGPRGKGGRGACHLRDGTSGEGRNGGAASRQLCPQTRTVIPDRMQHLRRHDRLNNGRGTSNDVIVCSCYSSHVSEAWLAMACYFLGMLEGVWICVCIRFHSVVPSVHSSASMIWLESHQQLQL